MRVTNDRWINLMCQPTTEGNFIQLYGGIQSKTKLKHNFDMNVEYLQKLE